MALEASFEAPPVPARPRRIPAVAEALGYLGGLLAVIGLVLVVGRSWPDMATAGRGLALSAAGALVPLVAGALVCPDGDPGNLALVASADGMRFVVPVRTLHAGPNPKYFGPKRGATWLNLGESRHSLARGIAFGRRGHLH